ncbi:ribosome-binding protein 1a isoform X1 [Gadus macrocephalus]|uniref:ribosome-binding protein 1a isoform X1 n=1 Tax=Gadus macrocephalus TaxID=80720 RepID=UPI0028CB483B|nr:ribosome-binding protein 1a isoform X1 [Gadus macrocephalus]XP_059929305.1 ribosome-binding protein 1a isoform X1 [Gadus macrocephalus]
MDIYEPQTLGILVFGGFMVISAIGIVLVSTFSMKETSYEEALAKQRSKQGKIQPSRSDKKKKDKASEKKTKTKKKDEKPNGKIPEPEEETEAPETDPIPETVAVPVVAAAPAPVPEAPAQAPEEVQPKAPAPAEPLPKDKKKKKGGKVEPVPIQAAAAPEPAKPAPIQAKSAPAQTKSAPPQAKSAPAEAKSTTTAAPAAAAAAKSTSAPPKSAPAKSSPASAPPKPAAVPNKSAPTQSAKAAKAAPTLEASTKAVPVMAVPPVAPAKAQEPKKKAPKKKPEPGKSDLADAPLYLPYKALVSTVRSMVFSEAEAHRLIEILTEKAGIIQDAWHTASQKGDPVAMLKKQLDEKEKQLAAEQDDAVAAKSRLREMTKELSTEKSKVASVETRLSSQLSKREQEMIALQARMQASYQDHVAQTQKLNAKVVALQEQLDKGPSAQLTRLQQENSILRDALNQATSQAESKQNAELAKLRQDCMKLTKELGEKAELLQADQQAKRGLEGKVSATENQLAALQVSHAEHEQALQRKLEEVCEELRATQGSMQKATQESSGQSELQERLAGLEAELEQRSGHVSGLTAQLEQTAAEKSQLEQRVASITALLEASEGKGAEGAAPQVEAAEVEQLKLSLQERDGELGSLHEELKQLKMKEAAQEESCAEAEQQKSEDSSRVATLEGELKALNEEREQLKNTPRPDNSAELTQLQSSLGERDVQLASLQGELQHEKDKSTAANNDLAAQLNSLQAETKATLQTIFPQIALETEEDNWSQVYIQKAQEALAHVEQSQETQETQSSTELPHLLEKLKEAEESQSSLQAECEQYRTVLAETEGMLKDLQNSVEEEELVWKAKMAESDEQFRIAQEKTQSLEAAVESSKAETESVEKLKGQMMLLEAQLEKQAESTLYAQEITELRLQLTASQSQLDSAQKEAHAHREELAQVREQLSNSATQPEHNGPSEAAPSQVQSELSVKTEKLHGEESSHHQLSEDFEQAQVTVAELQAQLDLLKADADQQQTETEDVAQLKERLEKEKKLSKDLGQAATKLQSLLKVTQEQLTKEQDAVRTLQEHLDGKGQYGELKEGTSV